MANVNILDDHRLELRQAKSSRTAFSGVIICIAGIVLYALEVSLDDLPVWATQGIGGALAVVGFVVAFHCGGAMVDRSSGTLSTWWGVGIPLFTRARRVEPRGVHLGHEICVGDGINEHRYPITLMCVSDSVILDQPDVIMTAWSMAQQVAAFLGVELIDESDLSTK